MKKLKAYFKLFITMFKVGMFTFGGGYAMIAVLQRELVERKNWIPEDEFIDLIAIAESTPGPLAINSATYIGYKICGFFGSLFATLGVVLPSFIIIFIISLFFDAFLSFTVVQYAFKGIQACVAFLILSAGIKMFKHLKRNLFNILLLSLTIICLVSFSLFAVDFSSVFFILIGGVIGLIVYLVALFRKVDKDKKGDK
jgi:chromate transporter